MKTLTVFTPAYNRAHLLPRLYESLKRQTCSDFVWMVVDDGSTDGTRQLVAGWMAEHALPIQYYYKGNGGMHTAHNLAYSKMETELNVCIDSDDLMPDDAVEQILSCWRSVEDPAAIAGIVGLDADLQGRIIGSRIPDVLTQGSLHALYSEHGVAGDKKIVLRTSVVREYPPYPEFENERLVPLGTLYLMIGNAYDFVYCNRVYCLVDYQEGGSSNTIKKQYFQSPRGFAYAKTLKKTYRQSWIEDVKDSVHIGISACITKDFRLLRRGPKSYLNYAVFPVSYFATQYLKLKE